jgi:hypothetical protein
VCRERVTEGDVQQLCQVQPPGHQAQHTTNTPHLLCFLLCSPPPHTHTRTGERHGTPAERLLAAQRRANASAASRPHTLFATGPQQQPQHIPEGQGSGYGMALPPPPGAAGGMMQPPPWGAPPGPLGFYPGGPGGMPPPPWAMGPPGGPKSWLGSAV